MNLEATCFLFGFIMLATCFWWHHWSQAGTFDGQKKPPILAHFEPFKTSVDRHSFKKWWVTSKILAKALISSRTTVYLITIMCKSKWKLSQDFFRVELCLHSCGLVLPIANVTHVSLFAGENIIKTIGRWLWIVSQSLMVLLKLFLMLRRSKHKGRGRKGW